ncbi:hypothetical protein K435DRAFT_781860 [Dendrothele bispora CBS 962.96]|uniref:Uncharacterized protein n=1 Tax=Dendrothele bispora (strain CBS 962.96) TaxID=1314807 RepID=A0A4S8LIN2_DENBC|nr:hypothetical protein K435DRAFT_781860 [Dendrothele bispora CBS 962.96]
MSVAQIRYRANRIVLNAEIPLPVAGSSDSSVVTVQVRDSDFISSATIPTIPLGTSPVSSVIKLAALNPTVIITSTYKLALQTPVIVYRQHDNLVLYSGGTSITPLPSATREFAWGFSLASTFWKHICQSHCLQEYKVVHLFYPEAPPDQCVRLEFIFDVETMRENPSESYPQAFSGNVLSFQYDT